MKSGEARWPVDSRKPTGQSLSGRVQRSESCDLIGSGWEVGRGLRGGRKPGKSQASRSCTGAATVLGPYA